jgi:hypothetical protein
MTRGMAKGLRQQWVRWFERLAEAAKRDAESHASPAAPVAAGQVVQAMLESRLAG